jgi:hypothetical protein
MENKKNKKGSVLNQMIVQIILIALILAMFLLSTAGKINGRGVRQQVLEKEIALLIDSAVPGMSFEISKLNANGIINSVELKRGRVFVSVDGLGPLNGYPYFSAHSVTVSNEENKFMVKVA